MKIVLLWTVGSFLFCGGCAIIGDQAGKALDRVVDPNCPDCRPATAYMDK